MSTEKGTVIVLGGDGFCGWPTSLYLSRRGYNVIVVDNLSRRKIDDELGVQSLTPIASPEERVQAWKEVAAKHNADWKLRFVKLDLAKEYDELVALLRAERPTAIVHFAEQRSAPYSMKSSKHKLYTVQNNLTATTAVLCAIIDVDPNIHLVHLGTMGVYGYGSIPGMKIPEGYMDVLVPMNDELHPLRILHPAAPGSVYHTTKTQDHLLFQFFAKNDLLRITDLHQGIVWGTFTDETQLDERLINRFDYDGDYGTVLNRFIMQASMKHPLTVYGTGGQTRGFIHIRDAMRCFELSIENPPARGEPVLIRNQITETHRVLDLAQLVARLSGAELQFIENPRKEAADNGLLVDNSKFLALNLQPTKLADGLVIEVLELAKRYISNGLNVKAIMPCSKWVSDPVASASAFKPIEKGKIAAALANGANGQSDALRDSNGKAD
jgi:UDP-sulfoquinovose synthase